jgi:hypothetical protein
MLLLLMLEERIRNGWISEVWTVESFPLCRKFTGVIDISSNFSAKWNYVALFQAFVTIADITQGVGCHLHHCSVAVFSMF